MSLQFPKKEKLKNKKLIEQLFVEGKSVSSFPIKLIYLKTSLPEGIKIQAAVTVPKKKFKSAVHRNRIKRLLRENYRLQKQQVFNTIQGEYAFLFLYLGKDMPANTIVQNGMKNVLDKFVNRINDAKID